MRNRPECKLPMEGMCEDCGLTFEKTRADRHRPLQLRGKTAKILQEREDHFKQVLAQFQGREGKYITADSCWRK